MIFSGNDYIIEQNRSFIMSTGNVLTATKAE